MTRPGDEESTGGEMDQRGIATTTGRTSQTVSLKIDVLSSVDIITPPTNVLGKKKVTVRKGFPLHGAVAMLQREAGSCVVVHRTSPRLVPEIDALKAAKIDTECAGGDASSHVIAFG